MFIATVLWIQHISMINSMIQTKLNVIICLGIVISFKCRKSKWFRKKVVNSEDRITLTCDFVLFIHRLKFFIARPLLNYTSLGILL